MEPNQSHVISNADTLFTFTVDNVKICKEVPPLKTAEEIIQETKGITAKLEDSSHRTDTEAKFIHDRIPGLVLALHTAYQYHYSLKLTVSDFIILIGQG